MTSVPAERALRSEPRPWVAFGGLAGGAGPATPSGQQRAQLRGREAEMDGNGWGWWVVKSVDQVVEPCGLDHFTEFYRIPPEHTGPELVQDWESLRSKHMWTAEQAHLATI